MKLNDVCNMVAAKILGVPGTFVREIYDGGVVNDPFEVVGLGAKAGKIELYSRNCLQKSILGSYDATRFLRVKL